MEAATSAGNRESERTGFLAWLDEFWFDVAARAVAHELSSEWHRRRGAAFGVVATIASALVGTAVFAAAAQQLDLSKFETPWKPAYFAIIFLAILAPALAAVQTNLKDFEQAEAHKKASAGYFRLKQRLDLWRFEARGNEFPTRDQRAYVSQEREELFRGSVTPTKRSLRAAEKRLRLGFRERPPSPERELLTSGEFARAPASEWPARLRSGISSLWLPAAYIAAAVYMGRSPQPLGDRIGAILIVGGAGVLLGAVWTPSGAVARRLHWIYRCLPTPIGCGVLLILLGNLLLFPSQEMAAYIVLWLLFDLGWRKPTRAPARPADDDDESEELPTTELWSAVAGTNSERR